MKLSANQILHGFTINTADDLPEIDGRAYVGIHGKSGARLLYLQNDDTNKSFAIGFRTPPKDDTGVFHILEHSVLCGSRRFPVKEPFVDLLKSSMKTFLNAMTFADKTLYPVASTNEQDLFNLMDVYLDAVFHPRIYQKRAIFEQEGWHYELRANAGVLPSQELQEPKAQGGVSEALNPAQLPSDQTMLVHNGVVFNEMKGALSDASSVLYDELQKALLPDTCYAFESGGTPEAIPTLTYEEFLDEHRRHYRTDNSYIILYGDLDIDRTLEFLDERYLQPVAEEQQQVDEDRAKAGLEPLRPRNIARQAPLQADHVVRTMVTAPENACAACGYVIGSAQDRTRALATEILLEALFGSNEAPMKRALLDAGVAHDVMAMVSDALLQPFALVQLQMPAEGAAKDFAQTLSKTANDLLDAGLDRNLVEAAISHAEFQMREHDMGYADGVIYSMFALSSWLYDDDAALEYLRYEQLFADLRDKLEQGYFEQLCRELFCVNQHMASVEVVPTSDAGEDRVAERLSELNRSLSQEQREEIVAGEALLRQMQEAPDTPEAIATLPRLSVADIDDASEEPSYALDPDAPFTCIRHSVPTRGIVYAYRCFDMSCLEFQDLPYAALLAIVLGNLDTSRHTAAELDTLVKGKLGNLTSYINIVEDKADLQLARPLFVVSSSALADNVEDLVALSGEIMLQTDFSDTNKVLDLLKQRKIALEQGFANAGHNCAAARCKSYFSASGVISEQISNVDFYRFVCDAIEHYDERKNQIAEKLAAVAAQLFDDAGCTLSLAAEDDVVERFWRANPSCGTRGPLEKRLCVPAPVKRNEAFIVPSDVCFAAMSWDWRLLGAEHDGSWTVAARALSYDYLWNEVRVKGGAYGAGFGVARTGGMNFYSYRDPHLDETLERFAQASAWLADFKPTQEDLEGLIVSSIAGIDAPVKPRALIRRQAIRLLMGRDPEDRLAHRRQIISTDSDAIHAFAAPLADAVDAKAICVFGNRQILESSSAGLELITLVG